MGTWDIQQVTAELHAREPIFHHARLGSGREVFEAMTSPDYWEVGASGRVYSRDAVVETLVARYAEPHDDPWAVHDFAVRHLDGAVWLATYDLDQDGRRSRRATVWRHITDGWIAEYHQGTLA